ncbi:uracil-DNA glycosylase family protein [Candidatus Lokiarchaeum ossiferum]
MVTSNSFQVESKMLDLYSEIIRCCSDECNEHGAVNDPNGNKCFIPRSFYWKTSLPKKFLIIATNPGKLTEEETKEYSKIHRSNDRITIEESKEFVRKHLDIAGSMFRNAIDYDENRRKLSFHRDLLEAISKVLSIERYQVFDYVNYTNLVKCQTIRNFTYLKKSKAKDFLVKQCYHQHLKREIDFLKPDLILAYGEEVYNNLPLRSLIPTKIFVLPRIWSGATDDQRREWRNMLDVVHNNIKEIVKSIKDRMKHG